MTTSQPRESTRPRRRTIEALLAIGLGLLIVLGAVVASAVSGDHNGEPAGLTHTTR